MANGDVLHSETVDRVRILTMNRPEARNALGGGMIQELYDALIELDRDDGVGVAVITGTDPAFCAGVDLKEAAADPGAYFAQFEDHDCVTQVSRVRKPVIGAVNGATFTGGLELALGCDFLVASERAYFADTHARVGVIPGGGLTVRLPLRVGLARAKEMSMTSELVDAVEAKRIGLVNDVVPHEQLGERAMRAAHAITACDGAIMRELKRVYVEGSHLAAGEALDFELAAARAWQLDDAGLARRRDDTMARNREQLSRLASPSDQTTQ